MSNLMLDVDQAGELKAAFRRGGWTNEEIKKASEGDFLAQVRQVLKGNAKIVFSENIAKQKEKVWPQLTRPLVDCPSMTLDATECQVSWEELQKVFPGGVFGDFENFPSPATGATKVVVLEQVENGKFEGIFNGISTNLKSLVNTPRQILDFCTEHYKWLRTKGYETFFLMEKDGEFFVAGVYVGGSGLSVYVDPLSYDLVWFASIRLRVVFPQPETLTT